MRAPYFGHFMALFWFDAKSTTAGERSSGRRESSSAPFAARLRRVMEGQAHRPAEPRRCSARLAFGGILPEAKSSAAAPTQHAARCRAVLGGAVVVRLDREGRPRA